MASYPPAPADGNINRTPHVPSPRWSIAARLAQTWWRNDNVRGIADPDPRTLTRGHRQRHAPRSPSPHSRRRAKREKEIDRCRNQVARVDLRLMDLANVWLDGEQPRALARALHAALAGSVWLMDVPRETRAEYNQATALYLPRRAWSDGAAFLAAFKAAARWITFAELQLRRTTQARLGPLLAALRPTAPPEGQPITHRPNERRIIEREAITSVDRDNLKRAIERAAARVLGEPTPTTT